MEDALIGAGLSAKEAKLYILLLDEGAQTAAQLGVAAEERRTNVYALLDTLADKGLVLADGSGSVRRFFVTDPSNLQKLLQTQQTNFQRTAAALQSLLPRLKSQYSLVTNKPGVIYMAGEEGLLRLLDDMVNSQTEVLLIASDRADVEGIKGFKERLLKRKASGVVTRAIAHDADRDRRREMYAERGMELRFMNELPFTGEVVVYEDNVAFTVYEPSVITTVVTNQYIAETMRAMFEGLWQRAE